MSKVSLVYYHLPGDADDSGFPNAFPIAKGKNEIRLRDVREKFPLPGQYHFRFKLKWNESGASVWMDVTNEDSFVPVFEDKIVCKVLRVSWHGGSEGGGGGGGGPAGMAAGVPAAAAFSSIATGGVVGRGAGNGGNGAGAGAGARGGASAGVAPAGGAQQARAGGGGPHSDRITIPPRAPSNDLLGSSTPAQSVALNGSAAPGHADLLFGSDSPKGGGPVKSKDSTDLLFEGFESAPSQKPKDDFGDLF